MAVNPNGETPPLLLTPRTGRTLSARKGSALWRALVPSEQSTEISEGDSTPEPLLDDAALPGVPPGDQDSPTVVRLNDMRMLLQTASGPEGDGALYVVSEGPAVLSARVAASAQPIAVSEDGRTIFFQRGGALWRLTLTRALPALLHDTLPPPLPDPPGGGDF